MSGIAGYAELSVPWSIPGLARPFVIWPCATQSSAHRTDLFLAICTFSQVEFITSSNLRKNLVFYFQ